MSGKGPFEQLNKVPKCNNNYISSVKTSLKDCKNHISKELRRKNVLIMLL